MAEVDEEQKRSFLDNGGVEGRSSQKVLFPHTTADIVISSSCLAFPGFSFRFHRFES